MNRYLRRIWAAALACIALFSLAACTEASPEQTSTAPPQTTHTPTSTPTTAPTTVPATIPTTVPPETAEPPAPKVGWVEENGNRYYYDENGIMQTGWLDIGWDRYYLNKDGTMAIGKTVIDGEIWYFGPDGIMLLLVNPWNFLPEGYEPQVVSIGNGHYVDERAYDDLMQMLSDCRADGLDPQVCSSYRTMEKQTYLYNRKVNYYLDLGYSRERAEEVAGTIVAVPGTSEHQLGLALDLVSSSNWNLDESQENTPTQKWLMANSWRYGWILRYPNEKSDVTGIIYEPWHYRYVGKAVAKEIYESGLCLEEYLETLG